MKHILKDLEIATFNQPAQIEVQKIVSGEEETELHINDLIVELPETYNSLGASNWTNPSQYYPTTCWTIGLRMPCLSGTSP